MKRIVICIALSVAPYLVSSQNHTGNFWISNGRLNVDYVTPGDMTTSQMDNSGASGYFGSSGIGALNAGDVHMRGFWGVVIDKNGGNLGESGSYSNGVNPAGGSFAVRTRISSTAFRTDLIIRNNGNVGIGTVNPTEKLVVDGNMKFNQTTGKIYWDWPGRAIEQYSPDGGASAVMRFKNSWGPGNVNGGFIFSDYLGNVVMRIKDHKVGIGTENLTAKLTVAGDVHTREVRVSVDAGADFVFNDTYDLKPLPDVEAFINANNHLPDVSPAAEMQANGIELGKMDIKLLQKVEELTLYLIEQNKKIEALEARLKEVEVKK